MNVAAVVLDKLNAPGPHTKCLAAMSPETAKKQKADNYQTQIVKRVTDGLTIIQSDSACTHSEQNTE